MAAWLASGDSGDHIIAGIVTLPETVSYSYAIVRLYQATFGRIPDQAGFIVNTLAIDSDATGGGTITFAQIEADFAVEPEFINKYGAPFTGTTLTQPTLAENFITELYQNVLERTGSTSEVNNWLATGDTAAEIFNGFVDLQEFVNDTNSAIAALLATNAVAATLTPPATALTGSGSLFAINLGNSTSITISGGGGVVNAGPIMNAVGMILNSLMSGDNLQDTAGDGVLNLSVVSAANPSFASGVTISGFSTLNFTNNAAGTVGAGSAGFQGNVTGLQTVNDTGSIGNLTLGAAGQGIDAPSGSAAGSAVGTGNITGAATGSAVVSTVNVTGYAGPAGSVIYAEFFSAAAGSLGNSIAFTLSGALGNTAAPALGSQAPISYRSRMTERERDVRCPQSVIRDADLHDKFERQPAAASGNQPIRQRRWHDGVCLRGHRKRRDWPGLCRRPSERHHDRCVGDHGQPLHHRRRRGECNAPVVCGQPGRCFRQRSRLSQ